MANFCIFCISGKQLCFHHSFILQCLESRTRPILTPCDCRRQWDSNLRTYTCMRGARSTTLLRTPTNSSLAKDVRWVTHLEFSSGITTLTANFCAVMDTLIDQDVGYHNHPSLKHPSWNCYCGSINKVHVMLDLLCKLIQQQGARDTGPSL